MVEKMKKYLFFDSGTDASAIMFGDFYRCPDMTVYHSPVCIEHPFLKKLYRLHNSYRINRVFPLPFRGIWNGKCVLKDACKDPGTEYYIGFTNASVVRFTKRYLRRLSQTKNVHLFLICLDAESDKLLFPLPYIRKIHFEKIFCFDKQMADKYGFTYSLNYYSKMPRESAGLRYDVMFVGGTKGRTDLLMDVYQKCAEHHVNPFFRVFSPGAQNDSVFINRRIPYAEVLDALCASNCILEVLQPGQHGRTLRYYEAVCYNKKLLTNNPEITELPYYHPQYMRYFEKADDIDFPWLREAEDIDYGYGGEFSPLELLKML